MHDIHSVSLTAPRVSSSEGAEHRGGVAFVDQLTVPEPATRIWPGRQLGPH
jgi:hypothetical protein